MRIPLPILIGIPIAGVLLFASPFSGAIANFSDAPLTLQQPSATSPEGAALYRERCAVCHDNPQDRVPPLFLIRRRAAEDVIQTLTAGVMRQQAAGLSADQIRALAVHLTGKQPGTGPRVDPEANLCKTAGGLVELNGPQWSGWGLDLDNSRFQPKPGIRPEDISRLKVKWAFAHPGPMATGQPVVYGDRLYVTTEAGLIYCLSARTGCTYWTANAGAEVRTAISVGPLPAGSPVRFAAYFGDERSNIHAVDAATGKPLWKTKIED